MAVLLRLFEGLVEFATNKSKRYCCLHSSKVGPGANTEKLKAAMKELATILMKPVTPNKLPP